MQYDIFGVLWSAKLNSLQVMQKEKHFISPPPLIFCLDFNPYLMPAFVLLEKFALFSEQL